MTNLLAFFEAAAAAYPDKTAVAARESAISFAALRDAARRLGGALRSAGPRRPIGVFADRTCAPVIGFLAALYSGNFYVPLDPDMPREKLQAILDDTQAPFLLGSEADRARLNGLAVPGRFLTAAGAADEPCPLPDVGPDDPAYMIYTSGSTGKPKGVLKSHGAVMSYIEAFCDTFPFTADEVIGNQTPLFFDASAKDLYLMLKTGATLELLPTELFAMSTQLIEYMNERRVTFCSWVPTALALVAQLSPFSLVKPEHLRRMFFIGEVMPMKHLNKWRAALPDVQYVNLYGQSELAGFCCFYEVTGVFDDAAVLPMGKPLENSRIYLMDGGRVVTEPGRVGEIHIASPALALGYWNDPEKTAASFLTLDLGDGPVRCFKTGDLAQYDADGNLVFAARSDLQIKHMGHRIELGEIEAVAGALPEIARCCCLYNTEKRKIVLFCERTDGCEATGREIQSLLRGKLSSYMVPGKVHILDRLPLNANGKIDRQKLRQSL